MELKIEVELDAQNKIQGILIGSHVFFSECVTKEVIDALQYEVDHPPGKHEKNDD